MFANHKKYFAEYSFADGYPYGIATEIISSSSIPSIQQLEKEDNQPVQRTTIFDLIKKDINSFDIETEISPEDLRLLRVFLTADSKRNLLLLDRMLEKGACDESSILRILQESPSIMRTCPSFFNIQIVEGCPQNCSYCPYPRMRDKALGKLGEMPLNKYMGILDEVQSFCEDAVVSVSLWGEPAFHSEIEELVKHTAVREGIDLIVETSGLGWAEGVFDSIASGMEASAVSCVTWIVSLDAWSEKVYQELRGEGFREALDTVETLQGLYPGKVYVQAVRLKENEEDLESFFRGWKEKTDNLIIQKYDHFSGRLPDRRVTDLSPLNRFPCWHNKRDVVVLMDGTIPLCREDTDRKEVLGNIFEDGLASIWDRGGEVYHRHLRGEYPVLCRDCDEYYTFNY
jgi:spiro-SPASM protein